MTAQIIELPAELLAAARLRTTVKQLRALIRENASPEELRAVLDRYADTRNVASPTAPPPTDSNPQEKA